MHVVGAGARADRERAAVDALLGPARRRAGTAARATSARDGRIARRRPAGGACERAHLLLPALHAVQDRVGWVSRGALNYICRRLTVPPAEAWGVRHLLPPVRDRAAAAGRGPRLRRHRLPAARRRGALRRARAASSARPARRAAAGDRAPGCAAPASACASARRRRWSSGPARRASREPCWRRSRDARPSCAPGATLAELSAPAGTLRRRCARLGAAGRRPGAAARCARVGVGRSGEPRRLSRARAATGRWPGRSSSGRRRHRRVHGRRSCSAAAARPFRPGASGRPSPRQPARAALRRLQRRRVRARAPSRIAC